MTVVRRDWHAFATLTPDGLAEMTLAVEGITCAACMPEIERALAAVPGVRRARVNLSTHRLRIGWTPGICDARSVVDRLEDLGYRAQPFDPQRRTVEEQGEMRDLWRAIGVAGFAAMNVMLLSVAVWAGNASDIEPATRDLFHWISAIITIPAVAYAGRPFFRSAVGALRRLRTNMDVPISIGVCLTVAVSLFQTMRSASEAYFDSVLMLLFFLLVGRALDMMMRRRTRGVAENIAALRAVTAVRIAADGGLSDVPLSAIDPGDKVLVRAGERVSVDGVVIEGSSDIDQSLVTGETALVGIASGARVYAGTLNVSGKMIVQATAAATGTLLDEVNRLVESAAEGRSRYLRLADRAARVYAPIVHTAAVLTFGGWLLIGHLGAADALIIAVSVLIITCPCALALAVPVVQVVASGALFTRHVLLNAGDAIERLAGVDTIVFDKTGTLTLPEPVLLDRETIDGNLLRRAGRLANASSHPLARIIAEAAHIGEMPPETREVPGEGIEALINGRVERLGSPTFCGVSPAEVDGIRIRHPDASLVAYAPGDAAPVVYALRQGLKADAVAVVADLKSRGFTIEILSGDRQAVVATVAAALGIDTYAGDLTPTAKIARLEALKATGHRVLMVGDGLNDAPALAAAHVSLSPTSAVHLAQASADGVFLGHHLRPVIEALGIARAAHAIMRQNLWFAALYSAFALPLAMAGWLTPLIAALAMSGSSLIVTLNALRLQRQGARSIASPSTHIVQRSGD
jgi:Cu2+-exporting ATPase